MDRQDIDALLIGALYGELTPAEEARLAAHLESHPGDRGALDDLKRAREAVRESRIFDQQLEPPQAISALLLQEAHRRAPKAPAASEEKASWFYRITRLFFAHPAMAAAAMLVLVVGVAGVLHMKKGDQYADQQVASPAVARQTAAPVMESTAAPAAADDRARGLAETAGEGSGYRVGLDETFNADTAQAAEEHEPAEPAPADTRAPSGKLAEQSKSAGGRRDVAKNKTASAIVVDTPRREPKELDAPRAESRRPVEAAKGSTARFDDGSVMIGGADSRVATGTAQSATVARAPSAGSAPPAAPMTPPPPPAPTKRAAPAKKEAQGAPAEAKPAPAQDTTLIAWARSEHDRAISLAGNGDCRGAARLAVTVESRAPEYYAQFMATDRSLKRCQAYVAAERERAAKERASKKATSTR